MKTKERKRQRHISARMEAQLVYTQPKVFNRNRFVLRLATVFAVVLALVFAMSIFFRVETVNVAGVTKYNEYDVFEASGIAKGEYLLTLSKSRISSKILQKLPYVNSVRIGIDLPGTVNIEIEELAVVYSIGAKDGSSWLMDSRGKVLEKVSASHATTYTKIEGVLLDAPVAGQRATAYEEPTESTLPEGVTAPVIVTAQERLDAAIALLVQMERNGIMGQAVSVDASKLTNLSFWYKDQYQVVLGDDTSLEYKMQLIKAAIEQMGDYRNGVLDVSFTIRPDEVIYTPFE